MQSIHHRDVKPHNILIFDDDGHARLGDLGLARMVERTGTATRVASLGFTAPEILTTGRSYPTSDLFSLACSYVWMCTGSFPGELFTEDADGVERLEGMGARESELVLRALHPDATRRCQDGVQAWSLRYRVIHKCRHGFSGFPCKSIGTELQRRHVLIYLGTRWRYHSCIPAFPTRLIAMPAYSEALNLCRTVAQFEAQGIGGDRIEPAHLLMALTKLAEIPAEQLGISGRKLAEMEAETARLQDAFDALQLNTTALRRSLRRQLGVRFQPDDAPQPTRSAATRRIYAAAENLALDYDDHLVRTTHLLCAVLSDHAIRSFELGGLLESDGVPAVMQEQLCRGGRHEDSGGDRPSVAARPTPTLDRYGRDLTQLARDGSLTPVIGRREEIKEVARQLRHTQKPNPVLVGEAGVGKTLIVEGLAQRLAGARPYKGLENVRIVEVSMSALLAGAQYRGDFEQRLQQLLQEASDPHVIIFIDEIHTMLEAGGAGASDAVNIMKPALARGDIRVIGATTWQEYQKGFSHDDALRRRFPVIRIEEPSRDNCVEILAGRKANVEQHYFTMISDEALTAAVDLSIRHLPGHLPDKAIELLEHACADAAVTTITGSAETGTEEIGRREVAAAIAKRYGVPLTVLLEEETDRLEKMGSVLEERIVGQNEAINKVCRVIRRAQMGLSSERRGARGSLLFVGSSGTGKTELAKALNDVLYGDPKRLLRLDMSEYSDPTSKNRLLGAPAGYVGYEDRAQLVDPMLANPHRVVLLDEIEKADRTVLDLLLQILDDGTLTDSRGRQASFREAVIILTSNLGSSAVNTSQRAHFGFLPAADDDHDSLSQEEYRHRIDQEIEGVLRVELINRLDDIVYFYPFARESIQQILERQLAQFREEVRVARSIELFFAPTVEQLLIDRGYRCEYGARELQRTIQKLVEDPLVEAIVKKTIRPGDRVRVSVKERQLEFQADEVT